MSFLSILFGYNFLDINEVLFKPASSSIDANNSKFGRDKLNGKTPIGSSFSKSNGVSFGHLFIIG